jgi:hypothetical protein
MIGTATTKNERQRDAGQYGKWETLLKSDITMRSHEFELFFHIVKIEIKPKV